MLYYQNIYILSQSILSSLYELNFAIRVLLSELMPLKYLLFAILHISGWPTKNSQTIHSNLNVQVKKHLVPL